MDEKEERVREFLDKWALTSQPMPAELEDLIGPDSAADGRVIDARVGFRPLTPVAHGYCRAIPPFPLLASRDRLGEAPLIEWPEREHSSR